MLLYMPLILNGRSFANINGPVDIHCLRPITNKAINFNYIILFGDEHNQRNYIPCGTDDIENNGLTECNEMATDFLNELNIFARTTRTDFYLESFKLYEGSIHDTTSIKNSSSVISSNMMNFINAKYNKTTRENAKTLKSHKLLNTYFKSNMLEIGNLIAPCYYPTTIKPEHCVYKQILWHTSDPRQSKAFYPVKRGQPYTRIELTGSLFSKVLMVLKHENPDPQEDDGSDMYDDSPLLVKDIKNRFAEFSFDTTNGFNNMLMLINNPSAFFNLLINSRLINKQYIKMNTYSNGLFTIASFVKHYNYWMNNILERHRDIFTNAARELTELLELFNLFYNGPNKYDANILEEINKIILNNTTKINYMNHLISACNGSVLDIYFILRINKVDHIDYKSNTKLVCGYFGANHGKALTNYFTRIIKTHITDYNYDSHTDNQNSQRRIVYINKTINLDNIIRLQNTVPLISQKAHSGPTQTRRHSSKNKTRKTRGKSVGSIKMHNISQPIRKTRSRSRSRSRSRHLTTNSGIEESKGE